MLGFGPGRSASPPDASAGAAFSLLLAPGAAAGTATTALTVFPLRLLFFFRTTVVDVVVGLVVAVVVMVVLRGAFAAEDAPGRLFPRTPFMRATGHTCRFFPLPQDYFTECV